MPRLKPAADEPMKEEFQSSITKNLHQLVEGMCHHRQSLKMIETCGDGSVAIVILPHTMDFRVVCGKSGRCINAIQVLAKYAGKKAGLRCSVRLMDSFVGESTDPFKFKPDPNFDEAIVKRLLLAWTHLVFEKPPGMECSSSDGRLKIKLYPKDESPESTLLIRALDSVFYPFGKANGKIVEISEGK